MSVDITQPPPRAQPAREQAKFIELAERRHLILTLRKRGLTYEQIVGELANLTPPIVTDKGGVSRLVKGYLETIHREDAETVEQLRVLENERLDEMLMVWGPKAREGDRHAAQIVLRISERRAKMNGLDAAQRHEHHHSGSLLHELGTDPDEVRRSREAFATAFEDQGLADVTLSEDDIELLTPGELPPTDA